MPQLSAAFRGWRHPPAQPLPILVVLALVALPGPRQWLVLSISSLFQIFLSRRLPATRPLPTHGGHALVALHGLKQWLVLSISSHVASHNRGKGWRHLSAWPLSPAAVGLRQWLTRS